MDAASPQATMIANALTTLANVSGEDLGRMIEALQAVQQRNALEEAGAAMKTNNGVKKAKAGKTHDSKHGKKDKQAVAAGALKRPLNSFMAFRKYYCPSFAPYTQKARSKCITVIWRADLFEAKWAIIAKAYSVIRGNRDKSEVPLDKFLIRVEILVVLIQPKDYLSVMGWKLDAPDVNDETKTPKLTRFYVPTIESLPAKYATAAVTVEDIVQHCLATRLISSVQGITGAPQNGALTMAVQPGAAANTVNSFHGMGAGNWSVTADNVNGMDGFTNKELEEIGNMDPFSATVPDTTAQDGSVDVETIMHPSGEAQLGHSAIDLELAGEWPYMNVMNPTAAFDNTFEPTQTASGFADEGMFDAFDMNGDLATGQQTLPSFDEPDFGFFVNEDRLF